MRLIACIATLGALGAVAPEPARAQSAPVPSGSFSQTCIVTFVVGGRLLASCRNMQGALVRSSIAMSSCAGVDVANINGMLTCGNTTGQVVVSTASRPTAPAGSVTVYQNRNFSGPSRTFTGPQANLAATGFYRQISSMRLTGGWQACTGPNYTGQCQSFAGQVSNLRDVEFDDVIISLRPLR